ncbi:MAG: hypothetical protein BGP16_16000 [Sphingobium sp. 66-54]|nr:MAG: hypothetical protein BGP16_16000 [Sphingobium sp. 66-54]
MKFSEEISEKSEGEGRHDPDTELAGRALAITLQSFDCLLESLDSIGGLFDEATAGRRQHYPCPAAFEQLHT